MGVNNYRIVPGDTLSPLLIPGENREVQEEAAVKLRNVVIRAAAELGFDKVSTAVVLADFAVNLMVSNSPSYPPESVREVMERAVIYHYGGER